MRKVYAILSLFVSYALVSCGFMQGMAGGMASYMGGYGAAPAPVTGMYGSTVPSSWGNGYAGPMISSDPVLNSTIGIAQTEARLQSQGVNISTGSSSSRTPSSSGSSGSGWYTCCSSVPNFGLATYHTCPNCGAAHQIGSGHMCKKK